MRGLSTKALYATALALAWSLAGSTASAQWLTLTEDNSRLKNPNGTAHSQLTDDQEKDYAVGDVDKDGDPDLIVVRKEPVSFPGKRTNYLFLNESANLVDRTSQYATASQTPGDNGFNTATDSRDFELADFNGDGWLDGVDVNTDLTNNTAASAKVLTHPRVYMNLGASGGNWLGFRHEDSRIPQLKTTGGVNGVVRFCDAAVGDPDADGDLDLYFVDYDTDENGHSEPSSLDLNDRLLINNGSGFFTDETSLHMSSSMSSSTFGTECVFADMNGNSRLDIVKITTLTGSPAVEVIYNDANASAPNGTGNFDTHQTDAWLGQPYVMAIEDLNNDGRLDLAIGDDGTDGYRFNTGNDAFGRVSWGPKIPFTWVTTGGNQGFPGQMYSRDYDVDGWNDVLITDVDIDLVGCNRRTQIYHNRTGTPGATNIILAEEAQSSGSSGWKGAVGWTSTNVRGVFDAANIDIDGDGDLDIILGKCTGTSIWMNNTDPGPPPVVCQPTIGVGGLGPATMAVCGQALSTGNSATLTIANGPALGVGLILVSFTTSPVSVFGGTLYTNPIALQVLVPLNSQGTVSLNVPGGGGPASVYAQAITAAAGASSPHSLTDALQINLLN